ncbi:hypothetical protein OWV82_020285 [Melia azedarach]|uniref:Uncharacterized protein n=1 Tax=Melia azedarach TaxID=155640 RepID=A0ACC1X5M3_MELAZ|nr:hypothetical protein OWV82_020285 [Melia azedarach]
MASLMAFCSLRVFTNIFCMFTKEMAPKKGKGKVLGALGLVLAELEAQPVDSLKKAQGKTKQSDQSKLLPSKRKLLRPRCFVDVDSAKQRSISNALMYKTIDELTKEKEWLIQ